MPDVPGQSYRTHVHRPRVWSVGWLLAVIAFVLLFWSAVTSLTRESLALATLSAAVLIGITVTRTFALRLQDRIIRLEMQIRLTRLEREAAIHRLSLPQIIALRFASDAELPDLVDRTLGERLTPDQIKRAVRDWQGDYLRT
jgi:hypothetical protein